MEGVTYQKIEDGITSIKADFNITLVFLALSVSFLIGKVYDVGIVFSLVFGFLLFQNYKSYFAKVKSDKNKNIISTLHDSIKVNRKELAQNILKKIFESNNHFHILVGTSGAGKSELIKRFFQSALDEFFPDKKKQIIHISDYTSFEENLNKLLCERFNVKSDYLLKNKVLELHKDELFIVLDQFESVFLIDDSNVQGLLKLLCKFFTKAKTNNINILIIIRKEWYFNLKFFQDFVPHIKDVHIVDGFDSNTESNELTEAATKLISNRDLATRIISDCKYIRKPELYYVTTCKEYENYFEAAQNEKIQLLPIEIITVLESLYISSKNKGAKVKEEDYLEGGKDMAIRRYFEELLFLSENEKDTARILYALSVEPKSNRRLSAEQISILTNVEVSKVNKIIDSYLVKGTKNSKENDDGYIWKHLIEIDGKYDWKHDFYADKFNEISGSLLDPIDRDNINFFWAKNYSKNILPGKFKVDENENNKNQSKGIFVFVLSALILLIKLFMPGIELIVEPTGLAKPLFANLFELEKYPYQIIDFSFIPIAICLTLWSWYVTTLFRRLLARINETPSQKKFSIFVCWWSLICVVLTAFFPELWLAFTGIGGMVVAKKYSQITEQFKSYFEIKRLSYETFINSFLMTIVFGPLYAVVFPRFSLFSSVSDSTYVIVSSIAGLIMFYFARMSIINHVSHYKIPIFLGLYNRAKIIKDKNGE